MSNTLPGAQQLFNGCPLNKRINENFKKINLCTYQ